MCIYGLSITLACLSRVLFAGHRSPLDVTRPPRSAGQERCGRRRSDDPVREAAMVGEAVWG